MSAQPNNHYEDQHHAHAEPAHHEQAKRSALITGAKKTGMFVLHVTGAPLIYRRGKKMFRPHYPEVWAKLREEPLAAFKRPVPMTETKMLHIAAAMFVTTIGLAGSTYCSFAIAFLLKTSPLPSWILAANVMALAISLVTCLFLAGAYGVISYRLVQGKRAQAIRPSPQALKKTRSVKS